MIIPRYWARSEPLVAQRPDPAIGRTGAIHMQCWGWSSVSREDAFRVAQERTRQAVLRWKAGQDPDRYGYDTRPQREEIVLLAEEDGQGQPITAITRNAYGVLVLNSAQVMFIDVDVPREKKTVGGLIKKLFGTRQPPSPSPEDLTLEKIRRWSTTEMPSLAMRVYRTSAGFRGMVTNRLLDPTEPQTLKMLRDCFSDPLYVRLCKSQACFRARLTPKPWRCGVPVLKVRYPFETPGDEPVYRQWVEKYDRAAQPYAVCKLVAELGPREVLPEVQPVLDLHDQFTRVDSAFPLK